MSEAINNRIYVLEEVEGDVVYASFDRENVNKIKKHLFGKGVKFVYGVYERV